MHILFIYKLIVYLIICLIFYLYKENITSYLYKVINIITFINKEYIYKLFFIT